MHFFRKVLIGVVLLSSVSPIFAQSIDSQGIINWLNTQGMTIYTTVDEYRGNDPITRGEASKMIAQFAQNQGLEQSYEGICEFEDIQDYDATLTPSILASCQYGLLKGSQSRFSPNGTLTQAQALVIIQRARTGFEDETVTPRYSLYFDKAVELGIVEETQRESVATTPISRLQLGTWLYTASLDIKGITDTGNPETVYIPQGAVAPPPIVIRQADGTTQTTATSLSSSASKTTRDETKLQGPYIWSFNYDTYQSYSAATLQLERAAGRRIILFFGSQSSLQSRALDTSIKQGVWGNLSILFVDFDTNQALKTTYGVSKTHTLIYLDSSGNEQFRTTSTDMSVQQLINNFDAGGSQGSATKI